MFEVETVPKLTVHEVPQFSSGSMVDSVCVLLPEVFVTPEGRESVIPTSLATVSPEFLKFRFIVLEPVGSE